MSLLLSSSLFAAIQTITMTAVTWDCFVGGTGTSGAVSVKVSRSGRVITLFFPVATLTVTTSPCNYIGYGANLPTWAIPTTQTFLPVLVTPTSGTSAFGYVKIRTDGAMEVYQNAASTAWPVGANTGFQVANSVSYLLP
jgi:hypothetical protein